ncbi:MAG: thioredoxin domain-containing protein, partial [Rhodospirillales bacterium]
ATAAECAAEQGRFWEMHHMLYEEQDQWSKGDDTDARLLAFAGDLNLDQERFAACFTGRKALERVLRDLYDAQGVVQTTPTFVVVYGGKATAIKGAKPADLFVSTLSKLHETTIREAEKAATKASE